MTPSRYYFYHVEIYPTKTAMIKAANTNEARPCGRFCGLCACYRLLNVPPRGKGPQRMTGCLGKIYLWKESLGIRVVVHEFTHAVIHYAEVTGLLLSREGKGRWVSKDEERFCHVMGNMMRAFTVRCYRLGFYK